MPRIIKEPSPVTSRQKVIYEVILKYLEENYTLPTLKEIAIELGSKNPNMALDHVKALIKHGWLEKRILNSKKASYKPVFIKLDITHEKEITLKQIGRRRKPKLKEI
tara:strand:+ start:514 stop:834 length:321 start_codon:yes stop_codon:yes gene_type:complete